MTKNCLKFKIALNETHNTVQTLDLSGQPNYPKLPKFQNTDHVSLNATIRQNTRNLGHPVIILLIFKEDRIIYIPKVKNLIHWCR